MSKNIPLIAQAIIDLNDMISKNVAFSIDSQMRNAEKPCFGLAWTDDAICKACEKFNECSEKYQVREIKDINLSTIFSEANHSGFSGKTQ